jgi:hypothetical protein
MILHAPGQFGNDDIQSFGCVQNGLARRAHFNAPEALKRQLRTISTGFE